MSIDKNEQVAFVFIKAMGLASAIQAYLDFNTWEIRGTLPAGTFEAIDWNEHFKKALYEFNSTDGK